MLRHSDDELKTISAPLDFVGINVYKLPRDANRYGRAPIRRPVLLQSVANSEHGP
jgi:hypothetical protein